MSGFLAGKVWHSALPPHLKAIAAVLADEARDDGSNCRPSVDFVAWKLGASRRAVQANLGELRRLGVLIAVCHERCVDTPGAGHGRGQPVHYQFTVLALPTRETWAEARELLRTKGATDAPFTDEKGAADVEEGRSLEHERAQPTAPDPSDPSEIDPLPQPLTRALRIVPPDERPQPDPLGPNARAVAGIVATGQSEQAVARSLIELRQRIAVEAAPPRAVMEDIAAWTQFLTLDDVVEVQRRAYENGTVASWSFVKSICGRAAAARRDGDDPWAPPAPGGGANAGMGGAGAARERPYSRGGGRGRVGASDQRGNGRDRQGLPLPDLEAFVAAQKPLGRTADAEPGAGGEGRGGAGEPPAPA